MIFKPLTLFAHAQSQTFLQTTGGAAGQLPVGTSDLTITATKTRVCLFVYQSASKKRLQRIYMSFTLFYY